MIRDTDPRTRRWTEEEEYWAQVSSNRDLGMPFNYDEASRRCEGEEFCEAERGGGAGSDYSRRPGMSRPDRMDRAGLHHPYPGAYGSPGEGRGDIYPEGRREETRGHSSGTWQAVNRSGPERGPYSGRGPKTYHRTDERVREDVCDALTYDGWIDASDMGVDVRDGQVTLSGTVPERSMKRMAEDAAMRVPGVRDVRNELRLADRSQHQAAGLSGHGVGGQFREQPDEARMKARQTTSERQPGPGQEQGQPTTPTRTGASRRPRIEEGMDVVDMKGNMIGRVKAVREADFLVDRSMARDLYVPVNTVETADSQIVLNVDEGQLESMGLPKPDLFS